MTLHEPTWDDARTAAYAAAATLPPQRVALQDALGLTLAEPIVAQMDVPAFDTSMMDGWAVRGNGPWTVRGRVLAGSVGEALNEGDSVEIATGAPVPLGTTAVVRREWATRNDDTVASTREIANGLDIRRAGDEASIGDVVLEAGRRVTPPVVGLAALVGNDELAVRRRPVVSALILGDELVTHGIPPLGRVRDALGVQLLHWASAFGAEQREVRYVEDTLDATVAALRSSDSDIVFTTGGTARGPVDHMHAALEAVGATLVVDEVKVRPGHPMLLAALPGGRFVVGLPGNPLAAVAGFLTLADPVLSAMAGHPLRELQRATTDSAVQAPAGERRLIPATRDGDTAAPTRYWGSAMLRGIASSDCFIVTEPGGAEAGDRVGILELPW